MMQYAQPAYQAPMSESQFMAWVQTRDERYELVEGLAMMQAGATRDHERVAKRVFVALLRQVDPSVFDVNKGDFGIRLKAGRRAGSILLPDVVVDFQSGNGSEQATETPVVVVEVLSESTDLDHHIRKFELYKVRDTLMQYVVFEQDRPKAYVWIKTETVWPPEPWIVEGIDGTISFPSVGADVGLRDVYHKP